MASNLQRRIVDITKDDPIVELRNRWKCWSNSIVFRSKQIEEEYQRNTLESRFPRARKYTIFICTLVVLFMAMGAYDHFSRHELEHWVTISRFLVVFWMFMYVTILLFTTDAVARRCCGARISKAWLSKHWQRLLAVNTLLACTYVAIAQATIMEDAIFFVLNRCEVEDLRDILHLPFTCKTHDHVTHNIEFEEMFPNWHLKNLNGAYMIYSTAMIVACQQLDWFYSSNVVLFISVLMLILNQIKAPFHDFSMYYSPQNIKFESMSHFAGSLIVILAALIMALVLLFQLTMSRRMRFGFHYRLKELRAREREAARDIMMVQHNRIRDMQEAWHILPNEIAFDSLLAKGSNGEVWRGRLYRHSESDSIVVAIKKIRRKGMSTIELFHEDNEDDAEWIEDEAKLMMCLRHERLVRFIGAGIIDGHRFIVEELMTGLSIERKLWDTPTNSLTLHTKLIWARDVATGMAFIHERKFLHRDLKSPNILYSIRTGRAKIADFGIGRSFEDIRRRSSMKQTIDIVSLPRTEHKDDEEEDHVDWGISSMTSDVGSLPACLLLLLLLLLRYNNMVKFRKFRFRFSIVVAG